MPFLLPQDKHGHSVQALAPGASAAITLSGSSQNATLPGTGPKVVRIAATGNCYVAFGTSGVTASAADMLFPAGVEMFQVPEGATHFAVIREGASTGAFCVTHVG